MICNNITFDGMHCLADMGLIYVPSGEKTIVAPQSVYSYMIAGAHGTASYGDQQTLMEYQQTGIFYPAQDVANEIEAQRLWRRIAQWLGVGRRQLILDSEPDKYIIAEVQSMNNDEYGWIDGGLKVTWLCQPCHWALKTTDLDWMLAPSTSSLGVTTRSWYVETSLPAPVDAVITNDGSVTITGVMVEAGSRRISFEGMELLPGERLEASMMTPIGAVIVAEDGSKRSALEYAKVFEHLVNPGLTSITGHVTYAETVEGGAATMHLKAHGCWR